MEKAQRERDPCTRMRAACRTRGACSPTTSAAPCPCPCSPHAVHASACAHAGAPARRRTDVGFCAAHGVEAGVQVSVGPPQGLVHLSACASRAWQNSFMLGNSLGSPLAAAAAAPSGRAPRAPCACVNTATCTRLQSAWQAPAAALKQRYRLQVATTAGRTNQVLVLLHDGRHLGILWYRRIDLHSRVLHVRPLCGRGQREGERVENRGLRGGGAGGERDSGGGGGRPAGRQARPHAAQPLRTATEIPKKGRRSHGGPTLQAGGHAHAQDGELPKVGAAFEHQRAVRLRARYLRGSERRRL